MKSRLVPVSETLILRDIDAGGGLYTAPRPIAGSINSGLRLGLLGRDQANSSIWRILLSKDGDVYIGSTELMGAFKLSLHASGDWRMAQTDKLVELGSALPKVLRKFAPPEDFQPGWKRGCSLILPITCISPAHLSRANLLKKVSWWTPLALPQALAFDVYVGKSAGNDQFQPEVESISWLGSIEGALISVHVVARAVFQGSEQRALAETLREQYVLKREFGPMPQSLGFVEQSFDGRSTIIDLGDQNDPFYYNQDPVPYLG